MKHRTARQHEGRTEGRTDSQVNGNNNGQTGGWADAIPTMTRAC
jgi:hypothetical protein